jgi:hypothetical protein
MDEVIEMLGTISLIAIAVVCASGVLMKHRRKPLFKIHRLTGYVAVALAVCHGVLAALS